MQFKDFTKEHIPIYGVSVLLAIGAVFFRPCTVLSGVPAAA